MVALLWAAGKRDAAIRLEELWNDLAQTHAFSLRCAYPMADFHREEHSAAFRAICEQHSGVIPGESYTSLASEADRLRNISFLQQKAQALETERAERKLIQRSLQRRDRKSTRLNSSHSQISYAVFCLKKKKKQKHLTV